MSTGGGSTTTPINETTTSGPWSALQPYINQGYQEVAKLYSQGPQKYTPWSQVAGLSEGQQAAMRGVQEYVNNPALQASMAGAQGQIGNLLNPGSNPYAGVAGTAQGQALNYLANNNMMDPSQGLNRMMYQNTQDPSLQAALGRGGNASVGISDQIRSQLQGQGGIAGSIADKARQANSASINASTLANAYNLQNQNRLKAADSANIINQNKFGLASGLLNSANQYGTQATGLGLGNANLALNAPITMLGQLNKMGALQQAQNQSQLADATQRWNFEQNAPYANLARFKNLINPNGQWGTTNTTGTSTTTTQGSGQGVGQMIGMVGGGIAGGLMGGPAGAMAGASLGGGLGGGVGGMFKG